MATTYSGQGCTGLVGPHVVALVRCDPLDELVAAMWPSVARGDLPTLLIALMGRLADLPDFALAQARDDRVVVLARGAVQVQAFAQGRLVRTIAAGSVTTWHEDSVPGADRVVLAGSAAETAGGLPLLGGVVAAGWLDHVMVRDGQAPPSLVDAMVQTPVSSVPVQRGVLADNPFAGPRTPAAAAWPPMVPQPPIVAQPPAGTGRAAPGFALADRVRPQDTHGGDTDMAVRTPVLGKQYSAVRCPKMHKNPPATPACRECHLPLDPDAPTISVPQPTLGVLRRKDTGEQWALDRPVMILGRAPGGASSLDRLVVPLTRAGGKVADLHAEVRVQGWRVEVVDLSGQSTQVINPDGRPLRLQPHAPARLLENGRLVLGDAVTFTFEVRSGHTG